MADILIKNMEMPKGGTLTLVVHPNRDVYLGNVLKDIKIGKAIELPPHGDLIERNELTERLQDFVKWCKDGRKQGAEFVLDCPLPNAPVVVEASR